MQLDSSGKFLRKPSILFVWNKDIKNPGAGGGTIELHAVMKRLADKGYRITQVSGNFPRSKKSEEVDGINIVRLGKLYTMPFFLWKAQLLNRFIEKFDVVVEGLGYVSLGLPLVTRRPLMVICAHLPKEIFFIEGPITMGKPLGYVTATLARFIESVLTPRLYKNAKVFTFSESTKKDMVETGFPENNVIMIPYALAHYTTHSEDNLKQLSEMNLELVKQERPSIVCIGRLRKYKGVQDLIKAVPKIKQDFPDVKVHIVGKGQYEEELKELAKSLGLEKSVIFPGYITTKEKFELIASSQLLVMPSYREGFATPVFEAQLCGTVPVVSDAVGVKELVVPGKTGLVFPRGNSEALAECVVHLLKDEKLRQQMRENGLQSVKTMDWRKKEEEFIDALEKQIQDLSGYQPASRSRVSPFNSRMPSGKAETELSPLTSY